MKTVNVAELEGAALDYATALASGLSVTHEYEDIFTVEKGSINLGCVGDHYIPSTDWGQGGPLITEFHVSLLASDTQYFEGLVYTAYLGANGQYIDDSLPRMCEFDSSIGPTPLIAACRAIVAAKLGEEVEIPQELMPCTAP